MPTHRRETPDVPRAARERLLRASPTRGTSARRAIWPASASRRWRRPAPARHGARACRWRGAARGRCSIISAPSSRRPTCRSMRISLHGFADEPEDVAHNVRALRRDRRRRPVDRGRDRRCDAAALRLRPRGRADRRGARGDRRGRRRGAAGGADRVLSHRPSRAARRGDPAARSPSPRPAPTASMRRARASDEEIAAIVEAVAPKPVNVLVGADRTGLTVGQTRRRSASGGSASAGRWRGWRGRASCKAAREIAENGRFDGFGKAPASAAISTGSSPSVEQRGNEP